MTIKKVKIRRPYDASVPSTITFPENTMAKQAFKDECNINTIMSKYQKTGLIEHVNRVQGSYGDFTSVKDYQLSLNQVLEAQDAFDQLPAKIRARFGNDPAQLLAFINDKDNLDEAVKLGLATPPPNPQPKAAPAASGEAGTGLDQSPAAPKAAPPTSSP